MNNTPAPGRTLRLKARIRRVQILLSKTPLKPLVPILKTTRFGVLIVLAVLAGLVAILATPKSDGTLLGNYTMRPPGWEANKGK
ncbi:MAG: hypothetical protein ACR2HF_07460 [Methylococcaceae bacterium]